MSEAWDITQYICQFIDYKIIFEITRLHTLGKGSQYFIIISLIVRTRNFHELKYTKLYVLTSDVEEILRVFLKSILSQKQTWNSSFNASYIISWKKIQLKTKYRRYFLVIFHSGHPVELFQVQSINQNAWLLSCAKWSQSGAFRNSSKGFTSFLSILGRMTITFLDSIVLERTLRTPILYRRM